MRVLKVLLVFFLFYCSKVVGQIAIKNEFSGGRFGDNLLSYLHAKWIAYSYEVPLLFVPFKYSDQLVLHLNEILLYENNSHFEKEVVFTKLDKFENDITNLKKHTLYIIPYFPEDPFEHAKGNGGQPWPHFKVDWKDKEFREIIRALITPSSSINTITPPKNSVNIALHIREGGGHDIEKDRNEHFLTKFPPISFYQEGLLRILSLFPEKSIYCHIFTDAKEPNLIIQQLLESITPAQSSTITFGWRKENNFHDLNVLEDFFSLFNFDVLIRPQSNFSIIPSLMHDYAVVFSPKTVSLKNGYKIIDQVNFEIDLPLYEKLLNKKIVY